MSDRVSIADADGSIERLDFLRRSPFSVGGRGAHKEWQHFCILGDDLDVLVNFSLSDDTRPRARRGSEIARLTVLARDAGAAAWDGDVDTCPAAEVTVAGGRIDARFGGSRLWVEDGAYHLEFALRDRPIAGALRLQPRVAATVAPNIPLPEGPPLHWVIVPRLVADGWVRVGDRTHRVAGAAAYHDHNFGHFLWGHAFSWVWGFCLPDERECPWSIAFVQLCNRRRTAALAQGVFVWRRERVARIFREAEADFTLALPGHRTERPLKIPRVMALLYPDDRSDVPSQITVRGEGDGDFVTLQFGAGPVAQVVIPNETDLGVTVINEVAGRASASGRIAGESLSFGGRAVCEFLRG